MVSAMAAAATVMFLAILIPSTVFSSDGPLRFGDDEWDHIIFTQQWPESSCEHVNATGQHDCEIPSETTTWTVHGLWPTLGNSKGPNFCNDSWKFDPSEIESILPSMKIYWPNLFADTELTSFWQHEWDKHGTCAASVDSLKGELKYFNVGLSLNKKYNILGALLQRGISPSSSRNYDVRDVIGALQDEFAHQICIGCVYNRIGNRVSANIYMSARERL